MSEVNYGEVKKNDPKEPKKDKDFMTKEEIMKGLIIFFVGAGLGLIIFLLSYFGLSYFKIHYIIKAFLAIAISVAILIAVDEAMGSKKSKMQAPILAVLFIAFVFTILNGVEKNGLPEFGSQPKMEDGFIKVKILRFNGTDTLRQSSHIPLLAGERYRVTVSGAPVNLIDSDAGFIELTPEHGPYLFEVDSDGSPTVKGLENGGVKSIVKIERQ
jgi:hypothetical protein